jgi:hypothetical protein
MPRTLRRSICLFHLVLHFLNSVVTEICYMQGIKVNSHE